MSVPSVTITDVSALQILDSRGNPTVQVTLTLGDGSQVTAAAPSGASTGKHEAVEKRDGGKAFGGAGVSSVVSTVVDTIGPELKKKEWTSTEDVDVLLLELDGTQNFSGIGANASLPVSIAITAALAHVRGQEMWEAMNEKLNTSSRLPVPHFNVINGGAHAPNPLDFQEFMIAPVGAGSYPDALEAGTEIYSALRSRLKAAGKLSGVGDEGGFAPDIASPREALDLLVGAISDAGYTPGVGDVAIAMDPAADGFGTADGVYTFDGQTLDREGIVAYYAQLVADYPIRSIEDPFHEDDHESWQALTAQLGSTLQIVGDDLYVTNADRIDEGAKNGLSNAVLIKPNQTGTVSGTAAALHAASKRRMGAMVSHRSGETLDTFIADLVVGAGTGQIKSGAPVRGERVAKYNRILEIATANPSLPYGLNAF